jgi:anti-anti-sigma regulatory factor
MGDADGGSWASDVGPVATRVGQALIVTLPRELDDATLRALRTTVLEGIRRSRTAALVFEASGLDVVDAVEFAGLAAIARSAVWLGVRALLVGLSAGVVAYLVDVAADTSAFEPFGTLDDALVSVAAAAPRTAAPTPRDDGGAGVG